MPQRPPRHGAEPRTVIYVARRGWHIDIGFGASDLTLPLAAVAADFPNVHYLFFGFGDRRYLAATNKNFPNMLAALWPGAAVLLVTGLVAAPGEAFGAEHVIRLEVTSAEAQAAQDFVWNSLAKPATAGLNFYARGPYAGSLYYSALPRYSALHTCNTWAAEVLQAADLPIHSVGVVFAGELWSQVVRMEAAARQPSADLVAAFNTR